MGPIADGARAARTSVFAAARRFGAQPPYSGGLGAGRIYFARAFKIKRGSHGACPVGIGMTDPFAIEQFTKLFISMAWTVK